MTVATPRGSPAGIDFANMSCPSAKNCWSAGYATGAGGATTPIMEHLRKGKFGLVRTPIAHAELEGLSCPTSRRCWVVGSVTKGTRTVPVIERWNGRKWSTVHATDPPGSDNFLIDISCVSTADCFAVGGYGDDAPTPALTPWLERWNGKKWTRAASPPEAPGQKSAFLNAITCLTAKRCTTVGASIPNGHYFDRVYSDRLTGKTWSLRRMPQPFTQQFSFAEASDVACPTAGTCIVAGDAAPDANGKTALSSEVWTYHAKRWRLTPLPGSAQTYGQGLTDVSCVAANQCWIVGITLSSTQPQVGTAIRWNGGSAFTIGTVAQPKTTSNALDAVGCTHRGRCYALGVNVSEQDSTASAFADRHG